MDQRSSTRGWQAQHQCGSATRKRVPRNRPERSHAAAPRYCRGRVRPRLFDTEFPRSQKFSRTTPHRAIHSLADSKCQCECIRATLKWTRRSGWPSRAQARSRLLEAQRPTPLRSTKWCWRTQSLCVGASLGAYACGFGGMILKASRAVAGKPIHHRAKNHAAVSRAECLFGGALGMRHQPRDIAFAIADARNIRERAVWIRGRIFLAGGIRVPKNDLRSSSSRVAASQ